MSRELTPELAQNLAHNNLLRVFSQRDSSARAAVIKENYTDDVEFHDPDGVFVGHEALNTKAGELLRERAGWSFVASGHVKRNHQMLYLAWGFGPVGQDGKVDAKATGADVILVKGGKISKFWVIIDGVMDVKM
jgi:hypothetical protein